MPAGPASRGEKTYVPRLIVVNMFFFLRRKTICFLSSGLRLNSRSRSFVVTIIFFSYVRRATIFVSIGPNVFNVFFNPIGYLINNFHIFFLHKHCSLFFSYVNDKHKIILEILIWNNHDGPQRLRWPRRQHRGVFHVKSEPKHFLILFQQYWLISKF